MTHICYIVKRFPRLSQTFVLNELLALQRQGLALTVVALRRSDEADERYAELRAPVFYLSEPGDAPAEPAIQAAEVARLVRRQGATHLHAHFATRAADVASRASEITGVPFSFTAHAHDIFHADVDRTALAARIARARFVVTVSDYNRRYLEALLASEGRTGRVVRLYNGIDLAQLRPAAEPPTPWKIASVGRLVPKKGFTYLIEAVRLLRAAGLPARCAIVGDGADRGDLERQIIASGLSGAVQLLGARQPAEVARVVAGASAFALPCVVGPDGDRDGMPTVLLEAMALGTPVVTTDVAGIPELVRHGHSGLLAPEGDPARLAEALARLLIDARLSARLRDAALARVWADFDLGANVARLQSLFMGAQEAVWAA